MTSVRPIHIIAGTITAVVLMTVVLGSWFTIDQGERGVVLRNGAFLRVAEPGLGFKTPLIESVVDISVRTEKQVYQKVTAYSRDIQLAELRLAVNYRLDPGSVAQIYETYGIGYVDRILTPRVFDEVKVVFGQFNARAAIEERGRFGLEVESALRKSIDGSGIILEGVQIEEIDFSKEFEASIEERMKAEIEVTRLQQNWEREKVQANIVRTQAQAQADAVVARAKANAEAIRLRGEAEAAAIRARAEALARNENLVELVKAEKWDGKLPTTMLPNSATPLISVK